MFWQGEAGGGGIEGIGVILFQRKRQGNKCISFGRRGSGFCGNLDHRALVDGQGGPGAHRSQRGREVIGVLAAHGIVFVLALGSDGEGCAIVGEVGNNDTAVEGGIVDPVAADVGIVGTETAHNRNFAYFGAEIGRGTADIINPY